VTITAPADQVLAASGVCHASDAGVAYGFIFVAGFAAAMWGLDAAQLQRTSAVEHMPDDFRL